MVDKIGKKRYNFVGRGSIGRASLRGDKTATERQNQLKAHANAQEWRNSARESILRSRDRLKAILLRNQEKTKKKLANRRVNTNISFFPLTRKFSRGVKTVMHSFVPAKPKYSLIEPKERLYGQKLKKTGTPERKLHPAIEKAVKEIRTKKKEV